jgi:hypothetical protein
MIALPILAFLMLYGCTYFSECLVGNGRVKEETREFGSIHSVEISGPMNLYVIEGNLQSVRIEAESNIMPLIQAAVRQGVLMVGFGDRCVSPKKPVNVYATMTDVEKLIIEGSGTIQSDGIRVDALELEIDGSGEITANVDVDQLITKIGGSGRQKLTGKATNHKSNARGSGEIEAYDLETVITDIRVSGSGKHEVTAKEELNIMISGSGEVSYRGSPAVSQDIEGTGSVKKAG